MAQPFDRFLYIVEFLLHGNKEPLLSVYTDQEIDNLNHDLICYDKALIEYTIKKIDVYTNVIVEVRDHTGSAFSQNRS